MNHPDRSEETGRDAEIRTRDPWNASDNRSLPESSPTSCKSVNVPSWMARFELALLVDAPARRPPSAHRTL